MSMAVGSPSTSTGNATCWPLACWCAVQGMVIWAFSTGPLEGIPFTAKDSYMVKGMTVASGSPAFEHLVATRDAFSIGALRDAGCVFIGLTNMPPMANGGMQRGLYGRAESPYNGEFLTSAFASGSSNDKFSNCIHTIQHFIWYPDQK